MTDFFKKNIFKDVKTGGMIIVSAVLCITLVVLLFVSGNSSVIQEVNVVRDGVSHTLSLKEDDAKTVEEALQDLGIELNDGDTINCGLFEDAFDVGIIVINSAVKAENNAAKTDTLVVFEETEPDDFSNDVPENNPNEAVLDEPEEETPADEDSLEEENAETEEIEELDEKEEMPNEPETPVDVPVITIDYEDVDETIPFETVYKYDTTMKKGDVRIENGQNGIKTNVYELKFVDGTLDSRKLVATKIKKAAVNKVVYEGTISSEVSSRGEKFAYSKVLKCMATAYTNDDVWGDRIAFSYLCGGGLKTRWGVIAVDPSVIPAGTKLYVKSLNGMKDYGYAIAADTGGSIIGNKIDLWMDNGDLCNVWGVKNVEVYVLEDQSADIFALRGDYKWSY